MLSCLRTLYHLRTHRFIPQDRTFRQEGVRENDILVLTDREDTEWKNQLEAILELLIKMSRPETGDISESRAILVIRGLIRGIPYLGEALDAAIFGKK